MIVDILNDGDSMTVGYWKQERLIVEKQIQSISSRVSVWSNLHGSQASPIAVYSGFARGAADMFSADLTDYVRAYPSVQNIYIKEDGKSTCTLEVSVLGLIDPTGVIIPPQELDGSGAIVIPPRMMIISGDFVEKAEFYATNSITWTIAENASFNTGKRTIMNISGDFVLKKSMPRHELPYSPKSFENCARYALVKWVSFTGIERVHWFEIVTPKSATINAYELQPIDNEYIEIKGRRDGLTLKLDGLDAYDVWYYADVLLSSKVEISLDGGQTFDRVQVTTKEIETPDFVANGKVELNVNWKKYDAVAM